MMLRAALNQTRQQPVTAHTETVEGQCTVALLVQPCGLYSVVYGDESRTDLDYTTAAKHYGLSLMHALQCAGQLGTA